MCCVVSQTNYELCLMALILGMLPPFSGLYLTRKDQLGFFPLYFQLAPLPEFCSDWKLNFQKTMWKVHTGCTGPSHNSKATIFKPPVLYSECKTQKYPCTDLVFTFIIEYSSLRDFYRPLGNNNNNNNRSIFIWGFLKDDILACVIETWD